MFFSPSSKGCLQQHFPIPKFRPAEDDKCNVIYKIPCASCSWSYIGETKRSFTPRRKERMRNIKLYTKGSNVAKHSWTFNHDIDFNNSKIIDKSNNRSRIERHWSHSTRQKLLGRTIIRARSQDNTTFSKRNTNFLSIFNILFSTYFYLLIYANFPLYLNFFRLYSSHVFIR